MDNERIADLLEEIGRILEIRGDNAFRVRAYELAAQTVRGLPEPLARLRERGPLERLPHIGEGIARKIDELLDTGTCQEVERLRDTPEGRLLGLVRLPGIGPKRARLLYERLGVTSPAELREAAAAGRIAGLPGFGERMQQRLLQAAARHAAGERRHRLDEAERAAGEVLDWLRQHPAVHAAEVAGSLRRRRETIGDLDILVTAEDHAALLGAFVRAAPVREVLQRGDTKARVALHAAIECDIRVVDDLSFGAAWHYFTGSKAHSIRVRRRAQERGLKINEYGVFRPPSGDKGAWRRVGGRDEEEVFGAVDLPWIPPEIRQDRGEIEAAEAGCLPRLLEAEQVRGDLHVHTDASDGRHSAELMASAAAARGYEYLAITDHAPGRGGRGLDARSLRALWRRLDRINERLGGRPWLLRGVEVEVRADGSLALPDRVLEEADYVLAAVHTGLDQPRARMTERVCRAIAHPLVHAVAHPTGRKLLRRPPVDLDLERVFDAALEHGVWLECDGHPARLDLRDVDLRRAGERGVTIVLGSDAHRREGLAAMRYAVGTARRAWLSADGVVNTWPLERLRRLLQRRRGAAHG